MPVTDSALLWLLSVATRLEKIIFLVWKLGAEVPVTPPVMACTLCTRFDRWASVAQTVPLTILL